MIFARSISSNDGAEMPDYHLPDKISPRSSNNSPSLEKQETILKVWILQSAIISLELEFWKDKMKIILHARSLPTSHREERSERNL